MEQGKEKTSSSRILTIPNLLSMLRIAMIPLLVWLYCIKENPVTTMLVLLLSGATDVVDGFIARRFNMISDFGKALDPVADKLTQAAMLFCMVTRFPYMWIPLGLMIIKEVFMGVTGLMTIYKTKNVMGADWHGKLNTVLLYAMVVVHLLWINIPIPVSNIIIGGCIAMMVLSLVLYTQRNFFAIREAKEQETQE